MVKDLHGWFVANLRNLPPSTEASLQDFQNSAHESHAALTFRISMRDTLLCPKASFKPDWLQRGLEGSQGPGIFDCNCAREEKSLPLGHSAKLKFTCKYLSEQELARHGLTISTTVLPALSIIIRLVGPKPIWQIVCASSSSIVPLKISEIDPTSESLDDCDDLHRNHALTL